MGARDVRSTEQEAGVCGPGTQWFGNSLQGASVSLEGLSTSTQRPPSAVVSRILIGGFRKSTFFSPLEISTGVDLGPSEIGVEKWGLSLGFPRVLTLLLEAPQTRQGRAHRGCCS